LTDAIRLTVKWNTPNSKGENRIEYHERFGVEIDEDIEPFLPEISLPYWLWFWEINQGRQKSQSGIQPIPAAEFYAWAILTDTPLSSKDFLILRKMDQAYCQTLTEEVQNDPTLKKIGNEK
jgi:hypothetical protein